MHACLLALAIAARLDQARRLLAIALQECLYCRVGVCVLQVLGYVTAVLGVVLLQVLQQVLPGAALALPQAGVPQEESSSSSSSSSS